MLHWIVHGRIVKQTKRKLHKQTPPQIPPQPQPPPPLPLTNNIILSSTERHHIHATDHIDEHGPRSLSQMPRSSNRRPLVAPIIVLPIASTRSQTPPVPHLTAMFTAIQSNIVTKWNSQLNFLFYLSSFFLFRFDSLQFQLTQTHLILKTAKPKNKNK